MTLRPARVRFAAANHMRFSLVVLFALLLDWKLMHVVPDWRAHHDALALCRWNGQLGALAEQISNDPRTCTGLMAGPYGRPSEVPPVVATAVKWLVDFARRLTTGT